MSDVLNNIEPVNVEIPDINSEDWTPFVLCELKDDEKFNGRPTVEGLRRITQCYVGDVFESVSNVVNYNPKSACVVHTIGIRYLNGTSGHFSGTADASSENSDKPYSLYPSALAETRAEGRAYKRLLKLRNVLMADEIAESHEDLSDRKLDEAKINVIDYICRKNNVNLLKLLAAGETKYEKISDIPYEKGNIIVGYLNDVVHGNKALPEELRGYDSNWRVEYESKGRI